MTTGRIDYAPDYKSFDVKPPAAGIVRFCPRCGRNDRVGVLGDHHFAGGVRCGGIPVELQYALTDPERSRLERQVVDTCSVYCASVLDIEENGWRKGISRDEAHFQHGQKQTAMIDAYKALVEFESLQEKE